MEGYQRTVRAKQDLDKRLKLYGKECRSRVNSIKLEQTSIQGTLLDLQSKTKPLNDTVEVIVENLKKEKKAAQDELSALQLRRKLPQNRRLSKAKSVQAVNMKALEKREQELLDVIKLSELKLEWITGEKQVAQIDTKTTGVINIMAGNKGFKGLLNQIRSNKQAQLPRVEAPRPDFTQPTDVCELIEEFQKLPKIYDSKPKVKRPEKTKVFFEQYKRRQEQRLLAMNYGTRVRIKRAQYHSNSLTSLYLPHANVDRTPRCRTTSHLHVIASSVHSLPPVTRAVTR